MSSPLSSKSLVTPFICGLKYAGKSQSTPAVSGEGAFFNTVLLDVSSDDIYSSLSGIRFVQKSKDTRAGEMYTQELFFTFPNGDVDNANRIREIKRAHYMIVKLTDNTTFVIGRNDYEQNTQPKITTENTTRVTRVSFKVESIFPAGRFTDISGELLPSLFPF